MSYLSSDLQPDCAIAALQAIATCRTLGRTQSLARNALGLRGNMATDAPAKLRSRIGAEALFDAWSAAQAAAHAVHDRWDLQPGMVAGWAAWPVAKSFKWRNRHGDLTTIKCPAQIKVPAARYWPNRAIPSELIVDKPATARKSMIACFDGRLPTDKEIFATAPRDLAADAIESRRLAVAWMDVAAERVAADKSDATQRERAAWFNRQAIRLMTAAKAGQAERSRLGPVS